VPQEEQGLSEAECRLWTSLSSVTGPKPNECKAGRLTAMKCGTFPEGGGNARCLLALWGVPIPSGERAL